MSGIILTFPILAGKVEAWRRFCQEISGSRQQMYIASRRRLGITHERLALVETAFGSTAVTTLEALDVELHGINLAGYDRFVQPVPPPQDQELLFEWMLVSGVDG
jgi:hypothetical protein